MWELLWKCVTWRFNLEVQNISFMSMTIHTPVVATRGTGAIKFNFSGHKKQAPIFIVSPHADTHRTVTVR